MKRIHLMTAFLIVCCAGASLTAQSVATVARQQRERKQSQTGKAVLTNNQEILPKGAEHGTVTVTNPSTPPSQTGKSEGAASTSGPTDNKGRDEKYWRTAFADARQDLKRAQDKLALLDLKMNDLQSQLYRESIYNREMEIRSAIADTEKEKAATQVDVSAKEKRISDLEDELRRSGGPAGWAR